ncbi:kinesin-like protein KIF16B isoform X2 [Actinia tenebrosa]|uniref:Kinesin-like protein KIF16B isoform X2 n=1 Tax=Actinia tenebrosa TaxID=6105 RepID=A0A6P8IQV7_ACTTE|nr:kinesin-like protein KIF16B isoform X2 [Actinia tenebrosa]
MASVKVAVRVRPLNKRELDMEARTIIEMEGKKTRIYNLKATTGEGERKQQVKDFSFDYSYWSADSNSSHFVTQQQVYNDLGTDVVKSAFEGYNSCIFAYGQTGSGKTYTMMGHGGDDGLIPRICEKMFKQMKKNSDVDSGVSFRTEVSFLEIYQEKVRDLLRPPVKNRPVHSLRVREHPKEGPYVQDLTKHLVSDFGAIEHLMQQGNSHRVTASTGMNDVSSRSHAIFTMNFTQAKFDMDMPCETTSKMNLVDLAGSERADATGLTGERLKEGANINKSLVTLGTVISALADASTAHGGHHKFVPYRDSVLTWLLKDSLGGNSKTVMIATISPADVNYAETMSTLRYANRAKNIINKPTINEDANVKLIRELRSQIEKLKAMISPDLLGEGELAAAKKLSENEARVMQLTDKWKDRWKETQKILEEREMRLQQEGVGIKMDSVLPHLVLVDDDLLSTGIVVYHLKEGKTSAGHADDRKKPDIVISGPETNIEHCIFEHNSKDKVMLNPLDSMCFINNSRVSKPTRLFQGDVIILGQTNVFRFNHPREAAQLREKRKSSISGLAWSTKFRSETDLFRSTGEKPLSVELEKAKYELEQQKQMEGQKLEEMRTEFEKQIQDEGVRLEEMRAELERQRKLHSMEAQNVEEARKRVSDMEKKHETAERDRTKREKELTEEIEKRDTDIKTVREQLVKLRNESEQAKQQADDVLGALKDKIRKQKEEEMVQLNQDVKRIVELEAEMNGMQEQVEKERKEMREKWEIESRSIKEHKEILMNTKKDYEQKFNSLEESKQETKHEKEKFEKEKREALIKIRETERNLEVLIIRRENALAIAENDMLKRREVVEMEMAENRAELEEERRKLVDKMEEHEVMLDHAADKLANAQNTLETKTREENKKIDAAKKRFDELQQSLAHSAKKAEEDLREKRRKYDEVSEKRQQTIDKERKALDSLRGELSVMVEELSESTGNDRKELEKQIQSKQSRLDQQQVQLDVLEAEDKNISEDIEKEFEEELERIQAKARQDQTAMELERLSLEELQDAKNIKLQKEERELKDAQKEYNEMKMMLNNNRKQLADVEVRSDRAASLGEQRLLEISKALEEKLTGTTQHDEVYKLRERRIHLKEIDVEGKVELAEKQEKISNDADNINGDIKRLSYELEEKGKAKEKLETELKELIAKFSRERNEESATLDAMKENIQDMEEEANLSRSLTENQIVCGIVKTGDVAVEQLLQKERDRVKAEMESKIKELEKRQKQEMEEYKQHQRNALEKLEHERIELEKQKEELEKEMRKEKIALNEERRMLERDKFEDIDLIIKNKEEEIEDLKEKAQQEIDELRDRLDETEREVCQLQEKLTIYTSMASMNVPNGNDDELMADGEVMQYMYQDENEIYSSNLSLTGSVTPPRITPPPTPVNRFLTSVNNMRNNQINVQIPRYILRGLGRDSYHVFEVKVTIGGETWSVYRRYRKFRELHNTMKKSYREIGELDFPNRRFFGNRAEEFVRARRAQLETYLKSFINLCTDFRDCPVSASSGRPLSKRDLCNFAPFFKQGIFEQTKHYS